MLKTQNSNPNCSMEDNQTYLKTLMCTSLSMLCSAVPTEYTLCCYLPEICSRGNHVINEQNNSKPPESAS